jgi:AcrR family transcriptional regulator
MTTQLPDLPAAVSPTRAATTKYRRGLETRQRVIVLTKDLIAEHGYAEVTLDQIAAVASVSKSSLLWHFGSKEALLAEAAISLFQEIESALEPAGLAGKTQAERLDDLFARVADYYTRNPETKGVVLTLLFSGSAPQSVREYIREGWEGHVRAMIDIIGTPERPLPESMARVLLGVFHGCYCHWYANGRTESMTSYFEPARLLLQDWLARGQDA